MKRYATLKFIPCLASVLTHFLGGTFLSIHFPVDFSFQIDSSVLDKVAIDAKVRTGDPFLVDLNISEFRLRLSDKQLTLLLDILNENFAGLGYTPTAIELIRQTPMPLQPPPWSNDSAGRRPSQNMDVGRDVQEILGENYCETFS